MQLIQGCIESRTVFLGIRGCHLTKFLNTYPCTSSGSGTGGGDGGVNTVVVVVKNDGEVTNSLSADAKILGTNVVVDFLLFFLLLFL